MVEKLYTVRSLATRTVIAREAWQSPWLKLKIQASNKSKFQNPNAQMPKLIPLLIWVLSFI